MAYKFQLGAARLSGSVTFKEGLDANDADISNVGDINVDSVSVDGAAAGLNIDGSGANTTKFKITLGDNLADALNINEGGNSYMKFITTNSSEQIVFGKNSTFASTTIADLGTVTTADINGGSIDGATLGAASQVTITNADMNGGTIDGVNIGQSSAAIVRGSKLEIDGANDYIDVDTDLKLVAAADIILDPAGSDVKLDPSP